MLNSYQILTALELLGTHTVEIKERSEIYDNPMQGVAQTMNSGKILCNVGSDDGSDDCELTPEQFEKRFVVTCGIFH